MLRFRSAMPTTIIHLLLSFFRHDLFLQLSTFLFFTISFSFFLYLSSVKEKDGDSAEQRERKKERKRGEKEREEQVDQRKTEGKKERKKEREKEAC